MNSIHFVPHAGQRKIMSGYWENNDGYCLLIDRNSL